MAEERKTLEEIMAALREAIAPILGEIEEAD